MADAGASFEQDTDESSPRFVVRDKEGLWVDLNWFGGSAEFTEWVDRMFVRGRFFRELDYPVFLRLAYDFEPGVVVDELRACEAEGRPARLRLAAGISTILPVRIPLYRGLKTGGGKAEYLFEPLSLEFAGAPAGGEPTDGEDGQASPDQAQVVTQKTHLDFDEFVAQMWLKGLRYGIDEAAVRKAIGEDFVGRTTVAAARAPGPSRDAGIEELSGVLRRDDAPGVLPDGRVNLARFRNRFPQIHAGAKLLRKTPLMLGQSGHELDGRPVAPQIPKDLDFGSLAGPGTKVESGPKGEYLVATVDGFLDIDNDTSKVSVTDKIVNRAGVSLRTTGDLSLMGDEYEEHGEIQERRVVEGLNITTFADVFGKIASRGGTVVLKKNLSGGSVVNPGGNVTVEGRASGATILAPGGEVMLNHAESSLVVGRRVVVKELAVGCNILADELEIKAVEASALSAGKVAIEAVRPRGTTETTISIRLPADGAQRDLLAVAQTQLGELQTADEQARAQMESLRARPGVANYMTIAGKLRRQELTLTAEQQAGFQKLRDGIAPVLQAMAQISTQGKARAEHREKLLAAVADVEKNLREAAQDVSCHVGEISADLIVRTRKTAADAKSPATLPPPELKAYLRATAGGSKPLFVGRSGQFAWCLADDADKPA